MRGRLAYTASHTDQLGHCRVATGSDGGAVLAKGRGNDVLATVLVYDLEVMLEELHTGS